MCGGNHEHYGMETVDEVFQIDIDDMFTMLFTDSPLFSEFIRRRRTYDVKLSNWAELPDENGQKTRTIYYTLSINYAIGPKCSPSTERQILFPESQPGSRYLIDADCMNGGVPYSDHFSTVIRYCMTSVGPGQTRLFITGRVVYHKSVWGVIRGFIEKTAVSGLAESFGVMADLLRAESLRNSPASDLRRPSTGRTTAARPCSLPLIQDGRNGEESNVRRSRNHRRTIADGPTVTAPSKSAANNGRRRRTEADVLASPATSTGSTESTEAQNDAADLGRKFDFTKDSSLWSEYNRDPAELLVVLLFIVIVALVIVNAALYYQVTTLESTIATTFLRTEKITR